MRLAPALLSVVLSIWSAAFAAAQAGDASTLRAIEGSYTRAIEKASAVTVSISVDRVRDTATRAPRMGGMYSGTVFATRPNAPVSGFIVEADGWIATTYFNIQGDLKGVEVTLPDGSIHPAKVMGWNVGADLALLKIEATGLPTLPFADPAEFRSGDMVVAVGRDPNGRGITANPGIISAAGRHSGRSIEVDARLNYGNVGGVLVDLEGKLVGMTCKVNMARAGDFGQNSGVSFVMIGTKIAEELPKLKRGDRVQGGGGRPFLGVMGDREYAAGDGARLEGILSGGAAEKAGLLAGDVIQAINGDSVANFDDLRQAIMKHKIGDTVKVKVKRGEEVLEFEMPLGENPSE
jgi:S1-C subfamily serine protease